MNDRLVNQLNMIKTCLDIAENAEHRAAWDGKSPEAFGEDLALLKSDYAGSLAIAGQLGGAPTGVADAKAEAETTLENTAYLAASALRSYYRKIGDAQSLATVDITKSHLQSLRDAQLVAETKAIHALAQTAVSAPQAVKYGVTPVLVAALGTAIGVFDTLLTAPRAAQVSRSGLRRELATRVAGHLEALDTLDDLAAQFATPPLGTPAGARFHEAWKGARVIVDVGGGPGADEEIATPPPAPPAPTPVAAK